MYLRQYFNCRRFDRSKNFAIVKYRRKKFLRQLFMMVNDCVIKKRYIRCIVTEDIIANNFLPPYFTVANKYFIFTTTIAVANSSSKNFFIIAIYCRKQWQQKKLFFTAFCRHKQWQQKNIFLYSTLPSQIVIAKNFFYCLRYIIYDSKYRRKKYKLYFY